MPSGPLSSSTMPLVNPNRPLPPAELDRIVHEDVTYDIWEAYLHGELLTTARQYDPARRVLAEVALGVLDGQPLYPTLSANHFFETDTADDVTKKAGRVKTAAGGLAACGPGARYSAADAVAG